MMTQLRRTVAVLVLICALAIAPSAHSAAMTVRLHARVRAKVAVAVVGTVSSPSLLVRANTPWTIVTTGADWAAAPTQETFTGDHTGDAGRTLTPEQPMKSFTVLVQK